MDNSVKKAYKDKIFNSRKEKYENFAQRVVGIVARAYSINHEFGNLLFDSIATDYIAVKKALENNEPPHTIDVELYDIVLDSIEAEIDNDREKQKECVKRLKENEDYANNTVTQFIVDDIFSMYSNSVKTETAENNL